MFFQRLLGFLFAVLLVMPNAWAVDKVIVGSLDGTNTAVIIDDPITNSATQRAAAAGVARPHGLATYKNMLAVGDFTNSMIHRYEISSGNLIASINTAGNFDGTGTVAFSPNGNTILAMGGGSTTLVVIASPFTAVTTVTLPGSVAGYQSQAIVFDAAGRAFVYHTTGISVLSAPYNAIDFTIPVANAISGAIAISPNGNTLLTTDIASSNVSIFTGAFSAASTATTLNLTGLGIVGLDGIDISPNGNTAIVADAGSPVVVAITAPFTAASAFTQITISANFVSGFEHVDFDSTGQWAALTGAGINERLLMIQSPFAMNATVNEVVIPAGGRGNGAVSFALNPNLSLAITGPANIAPGGQGTYTLTYANTGNVEVTNGILRMPLPAGVTFVSATGGGAVNANQIVWNVGTIAANTTNLVVQFVIQAGAAGTINLNATIEGDGAAAVAAAAPVVTVVGGPIVPAVTQPIPTMSEWMMLMTMLLLVGVASVRLRQS